MVGGSGGGPHALASAHLAGSRCLALLVIAGLAPYDPLKFDFFTGINEEGRGDLVLSLSSPEKFKTLIEEKAKAMSSFTFEEIRARFNVGTGDQKSDDIVATFQAKIKYSFLQGAQGWRDDTFAFLKPWGFFLGEISIPVQLWTGTEDVAVPQTHSQYVHGLIPNSELRVIAGKNHGTISEHAYREGFRWLREIFDSSI